MNELEIIQFPKIQGLSVFFDTVEYRTAHFHPEWELLWLLDRRLTVIAHNGRYEMEPGQMVLMAPNEPHEFQKMDREATFVCLQLSPEMLPEMQSTLLDVNFPHLCAGEARMADLRKTVGEIVRAYFAQSDNWELFCAGKVCLLLYDLLQILPHHTLTPEEAMGRDTRNARLNRLIRFVDEHYMHKIRLADFAAAEGCSLGYLSRFVKKNMNQSFQEYVNKVRFHAACQLMAQGNRKMLDICFESGFSDYRYFSRAFQEYCNMTPEAYSHRQKIPRITGVQRSLHSVEQFYSEEESIDLISKYI